MSHLGTPGPVDGRHWSLPELETAALRKVPSERTRQSKGRQPSKDLKAVQISNADLRPDFTIFLAIRKNPRA